MIKIEDLKYIKNRRGHLRAFIKKSQTDLDETCVLSYLHSNIFAAFVAWHRLFVVKKIIGRYSQTERLLDFGAGSGEIAYLLTQIPNYFFIEEIDELSNYIIRNKPQANRLDLQSLKEKEFGIILCLDSLEHNEDYEILVLSLSKALKKDGILIISGPTENSLYKIGRRFSGFKGDYHYTNVFNIEECLKKHLELVSRCFTPFGLPLFSISVWKKSNN